MENWLCKIPNLAICILYMSNVLRMENCYFWGMFFVLLVFLIGIVCFVDRLSESTCKWWLAINLNESFNHCDATYFILFCQCLYSSEPFDRTHKMRHTLNRFHSKKTLYNFSRINLINMVFFYLCNYSQYLWSNRLQANPHNIRVNDINVSKPCTMKSKMSIYTGKIYKNHSHLASGSDVCLWERPWGFSRGKRKESGQRKLIVAASFTVQTDNYNYALTFRRWSPADSRHPEDTSVRKYQQSTQSSSQFYRKSVYTELQRGFPDEVCCPLRVRHLSFSRFAAVICSNLSGLQPISN